MYPVMSEIDETGGTITDADELVRSLLASGTESHADYKAAMAFPPKGPARAKLAKQIIALCNRRDGGFLLIGVDDKTQKATSLDLDQMTSWDAAKVNAGLRGYAAPDPLVQVFRGTTEGGASLLAVRAIPFAEQPLVCIHDVPGDDGKLIIRAGALYIRTEATETKEVTSEAEMREILDRAYVRKGEGLLRQIKDLIDAHWPGSSPVGMGAYEADIGQDNAQMVPPT